MPQTTMADPVGVALKQGLAACQAKPTAISSPDISQQKIVLLLRLLV